MTPYFFGVTYLRGRRVVRRDLARARRVAEELGAFIIHYTGPDGDRLWAEVQAMGEPWDRQRAGRVAQAVGAIRLTGGDAVRLDGPERVAVQVED
jgi:hypothetical protein